jgi:hypothetical protein
MSLLICSTLMIVFLSQKPLQLKQHHYITSRLSNSHRRLKVEQQRFRKGVYSQQFCCQQSIRMHATVPTGSQEAYTTAVTWGLKAFMSQSGLDTWQGIMVHLHTQRHYCVTVAISSQLVRIWKILKKPMAGTFATSYFEAQKRIQVST